MRSSTVRPPRLAALCPIVTGLLLALAVVFLVIGYHEGFADFVDVVGIVSFVVPIAAFAGVGCVISMRRPGNAVGWMLAVVGLLLAIALGSGATAAFALNSGWRPKAPFEWIDVAGSCWVLAFGLLAVQLPMRVPNGRLPSARWRWFSRVTLGLTGLVWLGVSTVAGRVEDVTGTANPAGSAVLEQLAYGIYVLALASAGGVAALVLRYRRAGTVERRQLRWVVFGGVAFFAVFLATAVADAAGVPEHSPAGIAITAVAQTAFAALPVTIGIAILRDRLFDIDVVIRRTLVYGVLTATLAVVYAASVLLLQFVVSSSSDVAVAASTLAVAMLFRPARTRVQSAVDRRFYRSRYDARRTLAAFDVRLGEEVGLDAVSAELQDIVSEALQPAHVTLWMREQR